MCGGFGLPGPCTGGPDSGIPWSPTLQVHSVNLVPGANDPNQNRGYGFVTYTTADAAKTAMVKLHETCLPSHADMPVRCCTCFGGVGG